MKKIDEIRKIASREREMDDIRRQLKREGFNESQIEKAVNEYRLSRLYRNRWERDDDWEGK